MVTMKKNKTRPENENEFYDEVSGDSIIDNGDAKGKKKKKNAKNRIAAEKTPVGHILVKLLITIMVLLAFMMVGVACVKQFMIDKIPEQSELLPDGFVHEKTEKSPWDRFVSFFFSDNCYGDTYENDDILNPNTSSDDPVNSSADDPDNNDSNVDETPDSLPGNDSTTSVKRKDEFYNFLVIAKDKGGGNTDTMMVLSYDVPNKNVALLQIPRDTCVTYKNAVRKVNSVYSVGYRSASGSAKEKTKKGIEALSTCLVDNFGIVIDRYVIIDLAGFRAIVDTIGGVDVYVQKDMNYKDPYQNLNINLKAGMNHLDGKKAEQFVRFRKGYVNADLGRMDAQKIFMSAFLKKLLSSVSIKNAPELISHVFEYVETNVTLQEATYFGTRLLSMDMSAISMHSLQGTSGSHTYYNGASYFSPYKNANIDLVNQYFNVFNKDLGPENVNPKMLVKESGSGKYEGGKTAEEIDEDNPTLNYVY
ncbi:MAG: LytR family transcriptional regulator [Ruminococcaceae bacterium]|nr:LytR family transcriptional regulator [Oscillospiraceae bacterium]